MIVLSETAVRHWSVDRVSHIELFWDADSQTNSTVVPFLDGTSIVHIEFTVTYGNTILQVRQFILNLIWSNLQFLVPKVRHSTPLTMKCSTEQHTADCTACTMDPNLNANPNPKADPTPSTNPNTMHRAIG